MPGVTVVAAAHCPWSTLQLDVLRAAGLPHEAVTCPSDHVLCRTTSAFPTLLAPGGAVLADRFLPAAEVQRQLEARREGRS